MTDAAFAACLARTYHHAVTAFRPLPGGEEQPLYTAEPCALSRSAMVSAPEPPDTAAPLPESRYRLSLFTMPAVRFRLGDRLEVDVGEGRVVRCWASDSFCYPSHTVTVVDVTAVTEADAGEDAGQASHEAGEGEAG